MAKSHKYIFVVGGVMSGVGKGVATSSIGLLLQSRGFVVSPTKIDPYINVDAGTMNPTEHGEVFVLKDGYETDQDMGNYERFLGIELSKKNYMTTGSIYQRVIERERNLEYKGKCVEVVPHIPLEVIARIDSAAKDLKADVSIIEVGGTIGEYQNILFLEAARMLKLKYPSDVAIVLVSYLPVPGKIGEMKTKPTQYASRTLNGVGLQADYIIARSDHPLDEKRKEKLSLACSVPSAHIISAPDVESIYDIPLNFEEGRLGDNLVRHLGLKAKHAPRLDAWKGFVKKVQQSKKTVRIGIVGKYFSSGDFVISDSYLSVIEGLKYSAYKAGRKPEIVWLSADDFEGKGKAKALASLSKFQGIIVPGGFGARGIEGKLSVIEYARTHKIPYFGLCYGMQLMVIEYARNVLGLTSANTTEIDLDTKYPVIDVMVDQKSKLEQSFYGGTMRLGSYPAVLKDNTIAQEAYGEKMIQERHRHRYEVNSSFVNVISKAGLVFSGVSPNGKLMEIAELPKSKHPFFLGTQFHPEFTARPIDSHPLFDAFMKAVTKKK